MQLMYMTAHRPDAWLVHGLREIGHVVEIGDWGPETAALADEGGYDAVLADVRRLQSQLIDGFGGTTPLVLLADAAAAAEQTAALRAGADACLVRPLHLMEVHARLMAIVRLSDRVAATRMGPHALTLDRGAHRLALNGREAELSPAEFRLVAYLLRRQGQVIDMQTLDRYVGGEASEPNPERIRQLVSRLRAKLQPSLGEALIHSVRGHGYVLRPPT